jgi:hypothetical protein
MPKKSQTSRLIKITPSKDKRELIIHWEGKDPESYCLYTNCEAFAFLFLNLAHQHSVSRENWEVSPFGLHIKLPTYLLPFDLPFKRPYNLSPEDRERRREHCRQVGLRNRKLEIKSSNARQHRRTESNGVHQPHQ